MKKLKVGFMRKLFIFSLTLFGFAGLSQAALAQCSANRLHCESDCSATKLGNIDAYQTCRAACGVIENRCTRIELASQDKLKNRAKNWLRPSNTDETTDLKKLPFAVYNFTALLKTQQPPKPASASCKITQTNIWAFCSETEPHNNAATLSSAPTSDSPL